MRQTDTQKELKNKDKVKGNIKDRNKDTIRVTDRKIERTKIK